MSFDLQRFEMYLAFVQERHNIWLQRQAGVEGPWTEDPILASKKFTNVFRVLDPGSQFVLTDLVDDSISHKDMLMRLFLYRHTGRVEAWRFLLEELGEYPRADNLQDVLEAWRGYRDGGSPIFTGAYLVYPQSSTPGTDKLESIIRLTQQLFGSGLLPSTFLRAKTQGERFAALRRNKGVADFMSMQILTDWGYTPFGTDEENDFVVPGPGSRRGIQAITKTPKQVNFIHFARAELLLGDDCPTLDLGSGVRGPSIMDVQNTLCEFSKYVRFVEAGITPRPYTPAHPGPQTPPVLPQHWTTTTR